MTHATNDRPHSRWASIPAMVDGHAASMPDAPALAFPHGQSTFEQLAASSRRSARRLAAAGLGRGDRVALFVRELDEQTLSLYLGALRLGAVLVPINARNKLRELEHVLVHSEPSLLLIAPEFDAMADQIDAAARCRVVVIGRDARFEGGEGTVSDDDVVAREQQTSRDDPILILYTSGTTAQPKGCVHTHATLLAQGEMAATRLGVVESDRLWSPLTFFHVGGWQGLMIAWARGACYCHVGFFDAGVALDQLEAQRCTLAFPAFEPMWMAILNHPRFAQSDLSAVQTVINVAPPERLRSMQAALPATAQVSCIGMTEAGGSICIGEPQDSYELRTETSGEPLPGVEVLVVDSPTGRPTEVGQPGEMYVRSPSQFVEYYRDPERTAETIGDDGWVRTGDLVRRNEGGAFTFVSRLKDMLKVGGENVAAAEIEGFLLGHPDVTLAAVVPAPDARYGEVPAAFVEVVRGSTTTEQALIDFCLGQIATFKVPRYVRILEQLPTSGSGKLQKLPLQTQLADELRARGITEAPKLAAR